MVYPSRPRSQVIAERAFDAFQRFLHVEALSGVVLLVAAVVAMLWANSAFSSSYDAFWHTPVSVSVGSFAFSQSFHFIINDGLMTAFFLVVGMEIRRETHEGALKDVRQAMLPVIAAIGGVIGPALIYVALNTDPVARRGWAVPTATDIAFAVGILALLGRSIPANVRVFLLALAVIDDVVAILIIALAYSTGLSFTGILIAGAGVLLVLGLQRVGVGSAFAYVPAGAVVWGGFLLAGAHPTLAGVVLGMLTPVAALPMQEPPADAASKAIAELRDRSDIPTSQRLRQVRVATREILPPVVRVQSALHPWVAYLVMPLFALANAGVTFGNSELAAGGSQFVMVGIAVALIAGKPIGVIGATWLMVRCGWGILPPGVSWAGVILVGLLAGVGFTMSTFIALLAFDDRSLLEAAKLGVLVGSGASACLGFLWGALRVRRNTSIGEAAG
ncbi:MAG: Na+/H+ antiporter NhaA [Variibacter sp.]